MSAGHGPRCAWPLYEGPAHRGRCYLKVWPHELTVGTRFATEAESGCLVTAAPDEDGGFLALDSDGMQCRFHILAVVSIERSSPFSASNDDRRPRHPGPGGPLLLRCGGLGARGAPRDARRRRRA